MLSAFLAARQFLAKAPTWVWYLVIALIIAALLYAAGEHKGEVKVHRKALVDSVKVARAVQDTAAKKADTAVAIANVEEKKATPLRQRARAAVTDTSNHVPLSVIALVDSALAQDSTTIARKDTALAAKEVVIVADAKLDTLTEEQLVLKPPGDGGRSVVDVVKDVALVAAIVEAGLQLLRFLRGH